MVTHSPDDTRSAPASLFSGKQLVPAVLSLSVLFAMYAALSLMASGPGDWYHLDFVYDKNILWGDDAYRFFLVRSAWQQPELYFFNFILPVQVLLDGLLTTLAQDNLLVSRLFKCAIAALSPWLVYRSARRAGARPGPALAGATILALTPLYAFVSISFYAESWLLLLVSLSLYTHLCGRIQSTALLVGLMPLVRPEGIFLVAAFSLAALWQRQWRALACLGGPGFLYLLAIIGLGPGFVEFNAWRVLTGEVYQAAQTWFGGSLWEFLALYPLLWALPGLVALALPGYRTLRPFLAGAVALTLFALLTVVNDFAAPEPRYLVSIYPIIAVGFALLWSDLFPPRKGEGAQRVLSVFSQTVLLLFVVGQQLASSNAVSRQLGLDAEPARSRDAQRGYGVTSAQEVDGLREAARVVEQMTRSNDDINTVVVGDVQLFYFLDPDLLADGVTVVYPLSAWRGLAPLLGQGKTAGYFARPPYAALFEMDYPKAGQSQLLYLDRMGLADYPFHWNVRGHDIYLFGAVEIDARETP